MAAEFNENLTGRLNIDNLTDKAYVDAMGVPLYPAPGTHVDRRAAGKILTTPVFHLVMDLACGPVSLLTLVRVVFLILIEETFVSILMKMVFEVLEDFGRVLKSEPLFGDDTLNFMMR